MFDFDADASGMTAELLEQSDTALTLVLSDPQRRIALYNLSPQAIAGLLGRLWELFPSVFLCEVVKMINRGAPPDEVGPES
jgi:hypothetical protein